MSGDEVAAVPGVGAVSPCPEFEPRQIVVAHSEVWTGMLVWAAKHGLKLKRIPSGDDDLPAYCFAPAGQLR